MTVSTAFLISIVLLDHLQFGLMASSRLTLSAFKNARVLVCGDGDFSFSRLIATSQMGNSLVATTWDKDRSTIIKNFPGADENIDYISNSPNCRVDYGIDATCIPYKKEFDIVLWNFPHVNGKQNIRRNRILVQNFLISAKDAVVRDGEILCSLCGGQSGLDASTVDEWNQSWKLPDQVAEAGLLVVGANDFNPSEFEGYRSCGHRGYGGGFPIRDAKTYSLKLPGEDTMGIQAPMYAHEVHMLAEKSIEDLPVFEVRVESAVRSICSKLGWSDVVWSASLVDVYVCPRTEKVTQTVQICYCSLKSPIGRTEADKIRVVMETELPRELGLRPRIEKLGGAVSKAYPWVVAQSIKHLDSDKPYASRGNKNLDSSHMISDLSQHLCRFDNTSGDPSGEVDATKKLDPMNLFSPLDGDFDQSVLEAKPFNVQGGNCTSEIHSTKSSPTGVLSKATADFISGDDENAALAPIAVDIMPSLRSLEELERIRSNARGLWKRRVGVVVQQF